MSRFPFAEYAATLSDAQRDRFAVFAARAPADQVRSFVRYQLQMRHLGFKPKDAPWVRRA